MTRWVAVLVIAASTIAAQAQADSWAPSGLLRAPYVIHSATLLPSGRVLAVVNWSAIGSWEVSRARDAASRWRSGSRA